MSFKCKRHHRCQSSLLALCCGIAVAAAAQQAFAQQSGTSEADGGNDGKAVKQLDNVTVTVQRRKENLQHTPVTVSAITGAQLEEKGVNTLSGLAMETPSLQIADSGGGATEIYMRGIGSSNVTEVGDSAVAVHEDGIYIARSTSLGSLFYDIERVEVLRGPQGTLYGRNATAGAINIISRRPVDHQEGYAVVDFGNYGELTTSGAMNIPLRSDLFLRAAFQTVHHDGYLRTVNSGPAAGNDKQDQDDKSARVQLLYQPSDRFSALLRAEYLHQGGAGGGDVYYPSRTGNVRTALSYNDDSRDNTFSSGSGEFTWHFGFGDLTWLTGYNSSKLDRARENVSTYRMNYLVSDTHTLSNELRLTGENSMVKWVGGLYGFSENTNTDYSVASASGGFTDYDSPKVKSDTAAAYGQATWSLTDRWRLTTGLRYTHDKKSRYGGVYSLDSDGGVTSGISLNRARDHWNSTNWKLGMDYDLAPNMMLYGSVGTGYKAGGYYDGVGNNSYDPEKILAYELGFKSRLFENRLQFNADVFYYDYTDFQVTAQTLLAGDTLSSITMNADKATLYGAELESSFLLTDADRLDGSVSWLHARYTDFVLPDGDSFSNNAANADLSHCYKTDYSSSTPRSANFDGCKMAKAPEWTVNLGYEHSWYLDAGGTVVARVQTHYESSKNLEYHGFDENKESAFTKTDLSLTYFSADSLWSVMGYVRNVENDNVRVNSDPYSGTGVSTMGIGDYYAPPRTYGVRISRNF